jgi:hypothetical protein
MVPEGTKSDRSLPVIAATSSSSARTVGSSPKTSSPTSASTIAWRIAGVGLVTVSLRRSMRGMAREVATVGILLRSSWMRSNWLNHSRTL